MNRSFIVAVLTVTMIIMMSTAGYGAASLDHYFGCDNCHGKSTGNTAADASSGCIACHSSMGEASRKPVNSDAMANYFGSVAGQPATGSRSSHTWGATAPYTPAAKVKEPVNTGLNAGYNGTDLRNAVLCARCHDAKNTSEFAGVDKPFLRVTNVNDALCMDCHVDRKQSSHKTGTHPVLGSYSAVYKSNTTAFRKIPLSPNSNNPTAKLGNYLSNGKVVCSTCHAPHYADSSSATLDNRSTANGFAVDEDAKGLKGQLQNSKGQLLRTDPLGVTANSINVCSSCHKETKNLNHNAKGQNIQCGHCHSAHVDYTGDGTNPNIYLVRRNFSNMSTDKLKLGSNVKVLFNNNTGFSRADGKGVCQVCHALPTGHSNSVNLTCKECHKHSNGFSASNCSSCHGQPPTTSYVGGANGKSSQDYSLDESLTPHATHADAGYYKYACKNCHYDGTKSGYHNAGSSFSDVFIDTTGSVGDLPALGLSKNVPGDYKAGKTCDNVYCHSDGKPRGSAVITYRTTPGWENGKNQILGQPSECISCHQSGNTLNTNAHYAHVTTNNIKCFVCHAATVSAYNAIADRTKHANGAKDVSFVTQPSNFKSVFHGSFDTGNATCTNSCHTNGLGFAPISTAKWTETPARKAAYCGSCHAKIPATSLHTSHFTAPTGPKLGTAATVCANCHIYDYDKIDPAKVIKHANGVVDLNEGNSCAPCHPGSAPIWATGATVTCDSCHMGTTASKVGSFTASLKNDYRTAANGHYSSASRNKTIVCTTCHNAAANHIGAGSSEKRLVADVADANALCAKCHVAGKGLPDARIDFYVHGGTTNKFIHYTSASDLVNINNVRSNFCVGCHDTHGSSNRLNIKTVINGNTIAAYTGSTPVYFVSSPVNGVYNGLCQVCHTKTKYFRNNSPPPLAAAHSTSQNCLTCHIHKATTGLMFAWQPLNGGCSGCHGYPPSSTPERTLAAGIGTQGNYSSAKFRDYSGGGGAHTVAGHIPKSALATSGWGNCSNCHFNTAHNEGGTPIQKSLVNVKVDPKFKFNNATSIIYNNQTCSNVSCHFKPSPNWTNSL